MGLGEYALAIMLTVVVFFAHLALRPLSSWIERHAPITPKPGIVASEELKGIEDFVPVLNGNVGHPGHLVRPGAIPMERDPALTPTLNRAEPAILADAGAALT